MIEVTPLRSIDRDQAKREIILCLDDDPTISIAELAERLIIEFTIIEEIVGELRMMPEDRIKNLFCDNPDTLYSLRDVQELTDVSDGAYIIRYITKLIYQDVVKLYGYDGNIEIFKCK